MTLVLTPLREASSWGSLLTSYELWALDDNPLHAGFCEELMQVVPEGMAARPEPPAELYRTFRKMASRAEHAELETLLRAIGRAADEHTQMLAFWKSTLPAALNRNFTRPGAVERNLLTLEDSLGLQLGAVEPEGGETTASGEVK